MLSSRKLYLSTTAYSTNAESVTVSGATSWRIEDLARHRMQMTYPLHPFRRYTRNPLSPLRSLAHTISRALLTGLLTKHRHPNPPMVIRMNFRLRAIHCPSMRVKLPATTLIVLVQGSRRSIIISRSDLDIGISFIFNAGSHWHQGAFHLQPMFRLCLSGH